MKTADIKTPLNADNLPGSVLFLFLLSPKPQFDHQSICITQIDPSFTIRLIAVILTSRPAMKRTADENRELSNSGLKAQFKRINKKCSFFDLKCCKSGTLGDKKTELKRLSTN